MFLTPINKIDFSKVQEFCESWAEGPRVEYKSSLANVAKVVSSLANTSGGIIIFGVEIDKTTNMPRLPITGMKNAGGFEESVTQACIQGVYPPIMPAVKLVPIPSSPENVVVVVKITESLDAPHAIENSTKVFIRVNSATEPVQLADIDRIEWLLSRRKGSESRREGIIKTALEKFKLPGVPRLSVIIGPLYPHRNILTRDGLEEKVEILKTKHQLSYLVSGFRKSQDGYISSRPLSSQEGVCHVAISFYGFLFFVENLSVVKQGKEGSEFRVIRLEQVVKGVAEFAKAAMIVLDQNETINLFLRVRLESASGLAIFPGENYFLHHWYEDHKVVDTDIVIQGEEVIALAALKNQLTEAIKRLVRQLMWAFNWSDESVDERTEAILRANRLLGC